MAACRGEWGVYIQADEVLHETGAAALREKIRDWNGEARVEGLLVDYHHFYGDFDTIATDRHWYRREVRAIRLDRGIRSYRDAQGFRVGREEGRRRARVRGARMFHYGWARPPQSMRHKLVASQEVFVEQADRIAARVADQQALYWTPRLRRFTGSHPLAVEAWIAARRAAAAGPGVGPLRLKLARLRRYLSDWFERLTGARLFEYRNYVEVWPRAPSGVCASYWSRRSTVATTGAAWPSPPRSRGWDVRCAAARSGAEGGTPCWDGPSPRGRRRACVQGPSTWCSSSRARASLRPTSQSCGGGAAVTGSTGSPKTPLSSSCQPASRPRTNDSSPTTARVSRAPARWRPRPIISRFAATPSTCRRRRPGARTRTGRRPSCLSAPVTTCASPCCKHSPASASSRGGPAGRAGPCTARTS